MTLASMRIRWREGLLAGLLVGAATLPAGGVTHLRRGDVAPAVSLTAVDGARFSLEQMKGRPVALVFGELYHERSLLAVGVIQECRGDRRFGAEPPAAVLIVTQQADPAALREAAAARGVTIPVLYDRDRAVFAAYQVSVLPSVVVIDGEGRVVHALAGLSPALRDVAGDAMLLAAGKLDVSNFEKTLHPTSGPAESESTVRAARLTELARQLTRSGLRDLATGKYREALAVEPAYVPARIGLGRAALDQRRLAEAEQHFRAALEVEPQSAEAALGLAYVQALRGGEELPQAEQALRALLIKRPNDPEAHYLLGLVLEQAGRPKDAAASYRRSAELLLRRGGAE